MSMQELILNPTSSILPAEWLPMDEELLARLDPAGTLIGSTRHRAAINRMAAARWFLVRNTWGERCSSCRQGIMPGAIHPYITIRCREAPFNGTRQFYLWLRDQPNRDEITARVREYLVLYPERDAFVPISGADARRLNQIIRDRGGRPVSDQRPLRQSEVDDDMMRLRLLDRHRRLQHAAQLAGIR